MVAGAALSFLPLLSKAEAQWGAYNWAFVSYPQAAPATVGTTSPQEDLCLYFRCITNMLYIFLFWNQEAVLASSREDDSFCGGLLLPPCVTLTHLSVLKRKM